MADNAKKDQTKPKENKEQKAKTQQPPKDTPAFVRETGRGTVKSVPSGDTIVVLHIDKAHQGPPVERQITLSNIQAPLLRRNAPKGGNDKKPQATSDEAFAWASRDFLRKKCIGKQVQYTIEYKNPGGREFGLVRLLSTNGEPENLATAVVANGWAKVKRPPNPKDGQYRPEIQELVDLEDKANEASKGIFNKDPVDVENSKRPVNTEVNPATIFEQFKGKALTGIVESVRSGSSMRVVLLPSYNEIMLYLSGVQSPEFRQDEQSEPFAREAKFFTEHHVLNRDVNIILEAVDKYNCYGSVSYMGHNLAEELLSNGLGRLVDWSASKTAFADKLREAERVAREKKIRLYSLVAKPEQGRQDKQGPKGAAPGSSQELQGKVVEVLPNGVLTVIDSSGNDHKASLSSVRLPRYIKEKEEKKEEAPAEAAQQAQPGLKKEKKETTFSKEAVERAYAFEAREYLRKRLIGQRVRCIFDYTRSASTPQQGKKGQQPQQAEEKKFYSIYIEKNNVAVELVEQGLAYASEHRGGELRSKDYEHILLAEERAKKLARGLHAPPAKAPVIHIKDITQMEVSKARQYLPFLKRNGRQRGVVEFEFSATRLKIFVPKENALIALSLATIRSPQRNDPFAKEALTFTRDVCHQHDVEFEVSSQDRGGSFIGNVWVNKKNLATLLLDHGFAEIAGGLKETEHATEYMIAEESAKRGRKGIWRNYDEKAEQEKDRKRREEHEEKRTKKTAEHPDVVVTEIIDGSRFYVQIVGPDAAQLDELMKNLSVETSVEPYKATIGQNVKAQFVDDAWYRAKVKSITPEGEYEVFYIDYGNTEIVPASRLRALDATFTQLAPQAQEAQLAYIKVPRLDEDYGTDAALMLKDLVAGKQMMANLEYKDADGKLFLSLIDSDTQVFVNAALLRAGLARVERTRNKSAQQLLDKLREDEAEAKKQHLCIWEYGDVGSDDEDEPKKEAPTKKGPKQKDAPKK